MLARLRATLAQGNAAGVREVAHNLTGSSDYVGAKQVAKLATALENRARRNLLGDEAAGLLDAVGRLVRLLDTPTEAPFLAPLITREIVYRLWRGEQGDRLSHIVALGGYSAPIVKAIERLHKDFDQPLRIDSIAGELGMSASGFHHRFKAVTAMSPLQFQKRLRLQEARRLMLGEGLNAANTAYRVGYNDASQFNREYKRHFGVPPMRDVERLRGAARQNVGLGAD